MSGLDPNGDNIMYRTTDLYLAAFLCTAGVPFKGVEPESKNSRRLLFCFDNNAMIEDLKRAYFSRSADSKVVALAYGHAVKDLKALTKA